MIIMIICFIIIASIILAFYKYNDNDIEIAIKASIACSIIFCLITSLIISTSYREYLKDRAFFTATKEQYFNAVKVYKTHAEIDIESAAYTDFKYIGYQQNIGALIISLRNRIIKYNERIIKKRIMGKNLLFSWYVIEPDDDMVIIKMIKKKND